LQRICIVKLQHSLHVRQGDYRIIHPLELF
jgi:hypothetical protein